MSVRWSVCSSVGPVLISKVKSTHSRRILCRVSGLVRCVHVTLIRHSVGWLVCLLFSGSCHTLPFCPFEHFEGRLVQKICSQSCKSVSQYALLSILWARGLRRSALFLNAPSHLYKRSGPSVGRFVRSSIQRQVRGQFARLITRILHEI